MKRFIRPSGPEPRDPRKRWKVIGMQGRFYKLLMTGNYMPPGATLEGSSMTESDADQLVFALRSKNGGGKIDQPNLDLMSDEFGGITAE